MKMKKTLVYVVAAAMTLSLFTGCKSTTKPTTSNEKVKIEFMQYKSEAKTLFDSLIQKFEAQNPNIEVTQTNVSDTSAVLKTRISKGNVPDIVAVGADTLFAETSKAGVYEDLTGTTEADKVQSAYIDTLKQVTGSDKTFGIPYAANADAVIYNKKMFSDLGLTVPKTWDEFIAVIDKIKAAGKNPFYFTFKDSWTTLPAFNVLMADTMPTNFWTDRKAGSATFASGISEATDKFMKLVSYGTGDIYGKTYSDGNTAFAKGESVMYLQGIWAIADIKKANPNIDLGVFPYPVTNDATKNNVVSGVDLLLAVSSKSKNKEAAMKFIDFLLSDEIAKEYITNQSCYSALKGVAQDDAVLGGLKDAFAAGALVDFPDHQFPSSLAADAKLQALAKDKDKAKFLNAMDKDYDAALARQ